MEMENNSKRPLFLRWLSTRFQHAAKRVGESRNAVTFFHNHLKKRILSHFRPPVRAVEGKKRVESWAATEPDYINLGSQLHGCIHCGGQPYGFKHLLPTHPYRTHTKNTPVSNPRAWVSLQGRLVGAEEATSSAAMKGQLGLEEAAAWELFTPLQRVLIVAVVAVAALHLNKQSQMAKLLRQLEVKDRTLSTLKQELESMKHKQVSPVRGLDSIRGKEMSIQHEQSIVQQELDSMKQSIASLQKEIDNLKDRPLSRHRVVPFGASSSTTSEADWKLYRKQIVAEAELYAQEQEAKTRRIAEDEALYAAQKAADAELYKKQKEAEGIKVIADALTKATGDGKTAALSFKDYYLMIQQANAKDMKGLQPKLNISTNGDREKNDSTKQSSETNPPAGLGSLQEEATVESKGNPGELK